MSNIKLYFGIFLILMVVVFTLQNTAVVTTRFLFFQFSMSRALMIFLLFCAGILTGWFMHSARVRSRQRSLSGD